MRRYAASLESPARFSAPVHNGASTVTLFVIGELDVAGIPGLRRAIASLNGDLDRRRTARRRPVLKRRLLGRDRRTPG